MQVEKRYQDYILRKVINSITKTPTGRIPGTIMEIGLTITNHVLVIIGNGRSVIGTWKKEDGYYIAKVNGNEFRCENMECLRNKIKKSL